MMDIARVHPSTLESRDCAAADNFKIEGSRYRIVRSESVPVGDIVLVAHDGQEDWIELDPVAN